MQLDSKLTSDGYKLQSARCNDDREFDIRNASTFEDYVHSSRRISRSSSTEFELKYVDQSNSVNA